MELENRHMVFICSKGSLDMAYPALLIGWAALGQGVARLHRRREMVGAAAAIDRAHDG